jgi:2'-5' RNA ligase
VTPTETVRSFLAFEIPNTVVSGVVEAREIIRRELPPARWTRPEGWHLTLRFLGEVENPVLDGLTSALAPRLFGLGTVTVRLGESGFYPSPNRPRVAWLGGDAEGAGEVVEAIEAMAGTLGFERERRRWSAHLTLARLKSPWPTTAVNRFLEWGRGLDLGGFSCREVVLFSSRLQPGGPVYTALERMPLE